MNERIRELWNQSRYPSVRVHEAEKAQRQLDLITDAIAAVKFAADEERKITHSKHIDPYYQEALDRLDVKLTGARVYAFRVQTIGR